MSMGDTLRILNRMVDDQVISSYALGGAVAALNYIEPTVTEDLDILISFDSQPKTSLVTLGPIVAYLAKEGYSEWLKEGLLIEGWPVQFLPVSDDLDEEALLQANTVEDKFGGEELIRTRVLSAEHIVATAPRTGRTKDFLRIDAFLSQEAVSFEALRNVLLRHGMTGKWIDFCHRSGRSDPLAI